MQDELKNIKFNILNYISTVVIAFISFVGLILALTEFLEIRKKILGFGGITFIILAILIILFIIVYTTMDWVKNE